MRYERQIQLPEIGIIGQEKLKKSRVLVVGAGGLGCHVLPILVGAGVGFMRLYDADVVDETNLHRQTLYRMSDLGKPKVQAAYDTLYNLNPDVMLEIHRTRLTASYIVEASQDIDLVVDAGDNFATTYLLSDYCLKHQIPLISASVLLQKGYVGAFCGNKAPSYRALFPRIPQQTPNCNSTGVLGSTVAIMGSIQAQMVLSVLLGFTPSVLGKLIQLDFKTWQISQFNFSDAEEPEMSVQFIDLNQLKFDDYIVELRALDEINLHDPIKHDQMLTVDTIEQLKASNTQRIILVCKTGLRSLKAVNQLQKIGYKALAILAMG